MDKHVQLPSAPAARVGLLHSSATSLNTLHAPLRACTSGSTPAGRGAGNPLSEERECQPNKSVASRFLSTALVLNQIELATRWRMSHRTLERWRWLKKGPRHVKLGGRVLYRLEDVEVFERDNVRGDCSPGGCSILYQAIG